MIVLSNEILFEAIHLSMFIEDKLMKTGRLLVLPLYACAGYTQALLFYVDVSEEDERGSKSFVGLLYCALISLVQPFQRPHWMILLHIVYSSQELCLCALCQKHLLFQILS